MKNTASPRSRLADSKQAKVGQSSEIIFDELPISWLMAMRALIGPQRAGSFFHGLAHPTLSLSESAALLRMHPQEVRR